MAGLADQMMIHTRVTTSVTDGMSLEDPELLRVPFVLFTASSPFEYTQSEALGLGRYLVSGGFLYIETVGYHNPRPPHRPEEVETPTLRLLIADAFRAVDMVEGKDWRLKRLDMTHPVYHSFFDLDSLPRGFRDVALPTLGAHFDQVTPRYLMGIYKGEEMVGIYSWKGFSTFWAGEAERTRAFDRARSVQGGYDIGGEEVQPYRLGVNILLYALTRQGSNAQRMVATR